VALENAGYFLAVCGKAELPTIPNFVFVPEAANTLLERERHIHLLTMEVEAANSKFTALLDRHRAQIGELESSNAWAESLNTQLGAAGETITRLQAELARSNEWAGMLNRELENRGARIGQLQDELAKSNAWAQDLNTLVKTDEARILDLQSEVEVKNAWAAAASLESDQRGARIVELQQEFAELQQELASLRALRWVKAGKALRVVPRAQ
jgi:chromosome segregation ATPase